LDSIKLLNIEFLRDLPVPFGSQELLGFFRHQPAARVPVA
jgi:hypothetical protein